MASEAIVEGVFAINKPCGHSSAQMIRECQKQFNGSAMFRHLIETRQNRALNESGMSVKKRRRAAQKCAQVKMGHGGTLDPLATGVLILGIGSATKLLPQFLDCTKTYETTILFGASTDTYDRTGRVLTKRPYDHITKEMVQEALASFRGKQKQMPPLYSALKMNGKPLYEYAREGKPIPREIEYRDVEVLECDLLEWFEAGTHGLRWPTEEAEVVERNLAEQVWRLKKIQETGRKLTPEEKMEDDQAVAEHESFKRKFEQRQDELIIDRPQKKPRQNNEALMSGALGSFPPAKLSSKGLDLVPPLQESSTPPPWIDEGPAACKIRLTVTSGYYVRSFCHDLGAKLGSAGIMIDLCRVRQKNFTLDGANTLDFEDLAKGEDVWGPKLAGMIARWHKPEEPCDAVAPSTTSEKRLSLEQSTPVDEGNVDEKEENADRKPDKTDEAQLERAAEA
ncbi:hypothetical protein XA68_12832 [Ophiocordyceps unilateralis]|uniref:tRNA pseudouridine(55) synthase n=1 Tax=Ophiocordyceps unilateralis TaxID=268505 RepID=A0A2A9PDT7_OPHUN|nr:hypothetical protein XA68_12832 [Ophiocordyceps unilateralis]